MLKLALLLFAMVPAGCVSTSERLAKFEAEDHAVCAARKGEQYTACRQAATANRDRVSRARAEALARAGDDLQDAGRSLQSIGR